MSQRRRGTRQQQAPTPPRFVISKSPDFKSLYCSGVFGGAAPNDCRMLYYLDRLEPAILPGGTPGQLTTDHINREFQVEIHMTPVEFKALARWMTDHVNRYEERFGEIMGPPAEEDENPLVQ